MGRELCTWMVCSTLAVSGTLAEVRESPRAVGNRAAAPQDPDERGALRALARDLRDRWPDKRRRAVKKLAALGGEKAWELVIRALDDREPEVADEAQVRLGELVEPRTLKGLFGKEGLGERDEWVRLRVGEAFGRMAGPVDGWSLARALDAKDAPVARALLWSLERLADRAALAGDRERIARRVETCLARNLAPAVRASALAALAAVHPPDGEARAAEALGDREPLVRVAALRALHRLGPERVLAQATRLTRDPDPRVRLAAAEVLEAIGTRPALAALVDGLEREERGRLRWRFVDALRARTGFKHRVDPRPWRALLQGLPEDWEPRALDAPREDEEQRAARGSAPERRSSVALAGLPLVTDRLCVLVDFSGSLWNERADGRTRKDLLDVEIKKLLESLPEEAEFNLIPYTGEPLPWRERLEPARRRTVAEAARDFERCKASGKGNVFDAALVALADPRVDTILIVTDGAPTGGRRWNLELMVDLLLEESRWSGVVFHAILIDAPPRLQKSWRRLAEARGGRLLAVEFEDAEEKAGDGEEGGGP